MDFGLKLKTGPTIEPVTLAEAKNHLRVDFSDDDVLINRCIESAREYCESITRRQLITATWTMYAEEFPSVNYIVIPNSPLQSVNSIKYLNSSGVITTLALSEYQVSVAEDPGRIVPAYGKSWPSARKQLESVQIEFDAGYGDAASDVPSEIRSALLMMVGHLYEFREPVITGTIVSQVPMAVMALLDKYTHGWSF